MTIEDNVHIRDIDTTGKYDGYWQYVINGISYYLPNQGYLVMIDSSFKDIPATAKAYSYGQREYKIQTSGAIGPPINSKQSVEDTMKNIRKFVFQNYRRIMNVNAFGKDKISNNRLVRPPDGIMKMIGAMMIDKQMDLGVVISTYFRSFMNNRIGTYLGASTEVMHIRNSVSFKVGQMAVHEISPRTYKWIQVVRILGGGMILIMTKNNPKDLDVIEISVNQTSLKSYSPGANLIQAIGDYDLSEEKLLETYNLDRNT